MENDKLLEFETILRNHDPTFEDPQNVQECAAENYQVNLMEHLIPVFLHYFRSISEILG